MNDQPHAYPKATVAYRKALSELHFRADVGVPTIHCPATGRAVLPVGKHLATAAFENDPTAYLSSFPTVLFLYEHMSGEFMFLREDVERAIQARRDENGGLEDQSDFDVLVEHTPDFGHAFMVIDVEESAPGGHHGCVTIGFDLAAAAGQRG